MAKWSVALFNNDAPGKRMKRGDVVTCKPFNHPWTDGERTSFIIITVDGITEAQGEVLSEEHWDLESYRKYEPLSIEGWYVLMWDKTLAKANPKKAQSLLDANKDAWYQDYLKAMQERSAYPRDYLSKRRFCVQEQDVSSTILHTSCFDKKNSRHVLESDGLNPIKPLTLEEIEAKWPRT